MSLLSRLHIVVVVLSTSLLLVAPCWAWGNARPLSQSLPQQQRQQQLSRPLALFPSSLHAKQMSTTALFAKRKESSSSSSSSNTPDDFVDVDFERVVAKKKKTTGSKKQKSISSSSSTATASATMEEKEQDDDDDDAQKTYHDEVTNLFDLSFESGDPKWKTTRIPFCRQGEYIDGKLAFMVDIENHQYGIAIPFDTPVAIVIETVDDDTQGDDSSSSSSSNSQIEYVHPDHYNDNPDYLDLMEIMAQRVQEQFGEGCVLRKTPKVLTLSCEPGENGEEDIITKLTKNWKENMLWPNPIEAKEFLDEGLDFEGTEDEALNEFYSLMKEQLGQEEFDKVMNDDTPLTEDEEELIKFFDVPEWAALEELKKEIAQQEQQQQQQQDLETNTNDKDESIQELMESIAADIKDESRIHREVDGLFGENNQSTKDGLALKLIGYIFANGKKSYSLVKLLDPYVLVGRYVPPDEGLPEEDKMVRFELLTPQEEKMIIPKLEELCQQDLQEQGLSFHTNAALTDKTP